jgi:2-polyprenyl-3-methyl-5-hydroxy-6-metoxy-1,4-benzoquinol methylase
MGSLPRQRFDIALELGAGDGGQSETIARYCSHLICTEAFEDGNAIIGVFQGRNIPNVSYELCDALDLSRFSPNTFDFVFSSNMLEHVSDVPRCLAECKRVARSDAIIIHSMPSRHWKLWIA